MKSLRTRLLVSFALLSGVLLTLFGVLAYRAAATRQGEEVRLRARDKAVIGAKCIVATTPPLLVENMMTRLMGQEQDFYLTIYDPDDNRVTKSRNCPFDFQLSPTAHTFQAVQSQLDSLNETLVEAIT